MSPEATARLRALRDVGVLRTRPRVRYDGLEELAKNRVVQCARSGDGINVYLTDFGRDLAATLPPHPGRGIG